MPPPTPNSRNAGLLLLQSTEAAFPAGWAMKNSGPMFDGLFTQVSCSRSGSRGMSRPRMSAAS